MLFNQDGYANASTSDDFTLEEAANIMEQAILESCTQEEIDSFLADPVAVNEALRADIVMEKNIVRLDKKTKLSRAQKMAEFEIAKKKNDKDFRKLITVWKMERELEASLHKKYGTQAKALGKKNFTETMKKKKGTSMSSAINKATAKVKKEFNPEIKTKSTSKPIKPLPVNIQPARLK